IFRQNQDGFSYAMNFQRWYVVPEFFNNPKLLIIQDSVRVARHLWVIKNYLVFCPRRVPSYKLVVHFRGVFKVRRLAIRPSYYVSPSFILQICCAPCQRYSLVNLSSTLVGAKLSKNGV